MDGCERDLKYHQLPMAMIDQAVFRMIHWLVHEVDRDGYLKAVAEKAPDDTHRATLQGNVLFYDRLVKKDRAQLKQSIVDRRNAKNPVTIEILEEEQSGLTDTIERNKAKRDEFQQQVDGLPARDQYQKDAERIRRDLLKRFTSLEHLLKMPYDSKRKVLHTLFYNKGLDGIYIHRWGKRKFCRFSIENEFLNESEGVNKAGVFYSEYLRTKGKTRNNLKPD